MAIIKGAVAAIALVGALGVGGGFGGAAIAGAQPPLPADLAPTNPPATPDAQNGSPVPALGPDGTPDLGANNAADLFGLLNQGSVPTAPGQSPSTPLPANPLNNAYLLEQNLVPSAPGQGTVFGVPLGQEDADTNGADYIQRMYARYQQGGLNGAALGQRSLDQLGEPLPGTAPPPGTPMPPGLGQNLPDPPPLPAGAPGPVG